MTAIYSTDLPCRPVQDGAEYRDGFVESARDAAVVFANRYARRVYGKRGHCRVIRLDSWTQDGRLSNFQAFIGIHNRDGSTTGGNIPLQVIVEEQS